MNKHGQTLIIFVILIPIIITMIAVVVDIGILHHEYTKVKGVIDDGLKEYFKNFDETVISEYLELNDIDISNLQVLNTEEEVAVQLEYSIPSLFGSIINISKYDIQVKRKGILENEKILIFDIE